MVLLIVVWKRHKSKENKNTMAKSYGSNCSIGSICSSNMTQAYFGGTKIQTTRSNDVQKEANNVNAPATTENVPKKHKDLPPLVIHRRMSGNDVENAGIVKMEDKSSEGDTTEVETEEMGSKISVDRNFIKDYLKLVTVTPSEDEPDTIKSSEPPLSPRELFFIDLIREAEKAESNKANNKRNSVEGKHFFPKDFSHKEYTGKDNKVGDAKDVQNAPTEKVDPKEEENEAEREASYFIANIESPLSEKSEVFLEINPEAELQKEWTLNLSNEKPVLIIENANETAETKTDAGSTQDVALFEV